jgi:integrase
VQHWVDKLNAAATPRFYFRRPGSKRVPLPGLPWSPEFMAAYVAAKGDQPVLGIARSAPGSISALIALFYTASPDWIALEDGSTKDNYKRVYEKFRAIHGDKQVRTLTTPVIEKMLAQVANAVPLKEGSKRKSGGKAAANIWLKRIKVLMKFAKKQGWIKEDPARDVDPIKRKTKGHHTWTEEEIAAFEAFHPVGSKARLAEALLLGLAQRRGDTLQMGKQHVRGDSITITQEKTGASLELTLPDELRKIIEATPTGTNTTVTSLTFLATSSGKAIHRNTFSSQFRKWCDEAGLPKRCTPHGLRKAALTRLAHAKCSTHQIMSVSGHKTLAEV